MLIVDGDPWLVLEFVPSQNLSGALETRGPMAPGDAAALFTWWQANDFQVPR